MLLLRMDIEHSLFMNIANYIISIIVLYIYIYIYTHTTSQKYLVTLKNLYLKVLFLMK